MASGSSGNRTYMALGFLDFLAYYVPGVLLVLIVCVVSAVLHLRLSRLVEAVNELGNDTYIRGATWTVLSLIVPYVIGHLVFPLGYWLATAAPFAAKPENGNALASGQCSVGKGKYCQIESREFAECLFRCFQVSSAAFNDLMITRFRTLSRFCRSMLLPTALLGVSLVVVGVAQVWQRHVMDGSAVLVAGGLVCLAFVGFGKRYRKYERRWRNGICVAGKRYAAESADSPALQASRSRD